jgi:hypothetical protein
MSDLANAIAGDARLMILKELNRQVDGRMNELLLRRVLDIYGIRRDRDWIATQLRKLEVLGAIEVQDNGGVLVARILAAGRDHVEERAIIEGVTRPSEAA